MNEFLLIFRRSNEVEAHLTPEQLKEISKPWQDWMGSLAAQNKLANPGARLHLAGKVVKADNVITNGPYVEIKESIGGFITIKASSLDEAAEISKGCPILTVGGSVEVREVVQLDL